MDVIGELEVRIIEGNCGTVTSLGDRSRQRKEVEGGGDGK